MHLAETLASELSGLTQAARLDQLSADLDNLRGTRALLALYIADSDGTLVYFNEPAGRIAGRSFAEAGEMSLRQWVELIRPRDLDGTPLRRADMPGPIAFMEQRPAHARLRITGLDGVEREITSTAFPLLGPDGEFHGITVMFWEQD
jgi:PAS domain-containing protein